MKYITTLTCLLYFSITMGQDLSGSWILVEENGSKVNDKEVYAIFQDGYFAVGAKKTADNEFLYAYGGKFTANKASFSVKYDFHTTKSRLVGSRKDHRIIQYGHKLNVFQKGKTEVWKRISNEENELSGNWAITGRERNGEIKTIAPGDRRTIKILGGNRFQWVAFNSATREFHGTGGGTYTAQEGVYTETIDFFSKDKERVGAELQFEYKLEDGEWHHKGESSKGDPIYEIWSPYRKAYKG